jgi:hypothetical protein
MKRWLIGLTLCALAALEREIEAFKQRVSAQAD